MDLSGHIPAVVLNGHLVDAAHGRVPRRRLEVIGRACMELSLSATLLLQLRAVLLPSGIQIIVFRFDRAMTTLEFVLNFRGLHYKSIYL